MFLRDEESGGGQLSLCSTFVWNLEEEKRKKMLLPLPVCTNVINVVMLAYSDWPC